MIFKGFADFKKVKSRYSFIFFHLERLHIQIALFSRDELSFYSFGVVTFSEGDELIFKC